jgi:hypothetical protein
MRDMDVLQRLEQWLNEKTDHDLCRSVEMRGCLNCEGGPWWVALIHPLSRGEISKERRLRKNPHWRPEFHVADGSGATLGAAIEDALRKVKCL